MTTPNSYFGTLNTGSKSGPGINEKPIIRMFPAFSSSGSGSQPIPAGSPLAGGTVGVSYTDNITAQGGVTPYTFSISSGSLPAGLSINSSTGTISGTPSATGTSTFTVKVTDANSSTGTNSFQITVTSASVVNYGFVA